MVEPKRIAQWRMWHVRGCWSKEWKWRNAQDKWWERETSLYSLSCFDAKVWIAVAKELRKLERDLLSITSLAHLKAIVLLLDVSGSCGYNIAQPIALFHSIKPLFVNKPLIVMCMRSIQLPSIQMKPNRRVIQRIESLKVCTKLGWLTWHSAHTNGDYIYSMPL